MPLRLLARRLRFAPGLVRPRTLALAFTFLLGTGARAVHAQVRFSIDYRGATIGVPDTITFVPISAGDILAPGLPGLAPGYAPPALPGPGTVVAIGPGGLGLPTAGFCFPAGPGVACPFEVDALSYGTDFDPNMGPKIAGRWVFSVDQAAMGIAGSLLAPNVASEGAAGEACADVFESLAVPGGPVAPPPFYAAYGNTGIFDGNGYVSPTGGRYPGLGLVEPRAPAAFVGGDNIDALDLDSPPGLAPVYFSLDAVWPDPLLAVGNTGSAAVNGYLAGMILQAPPGPGAVPPAGNPPGSPGIYAAPPLLGLDTFSAIPGVVPGPGTDDLDALSLTENGVPGFQPVPTAAVPVADVVFFSVRRGSAVIGVPDSLFGLAIEPGDILTLPAVPGGPPSIHIAAEWLGLATARGPFGLTFGDDLDGLDCRAMPPTGVPFCFGDGFPNVCACGNAGAPGNGCANSANPAGANLAAAGAASLFADTVVLTTSGMLPAVPCIFLQGGTQVAPIAFGDGLRCVAGPAILRLTVKFAVGGAASYPVGADPTISVRSAALGDVIAPGTARYYQTYYRDPPTAFACGGGAVHNISNGEAIVWMP